ncbi:hypothetical protein QEV83_05300 [Methylocapsa sp. D3K7]|uniref:hypothetical protein n=1 Tax=Methylocapsa sp. D3K7 TaxID=3041435 RepID=UPI00244ED270|nr:hypothetical protein [Methylocapsa sp. D3K7]WGJ15679.1 hypothetical protein QEV83_05300 [Methylocapsa sp. D3K7]
MALDMERKKRHRPSGGTGTLLQQMPRQYRANLAGPVNQSFLGSGQSRDIDAVLAKKLTFMADRGLVAMGVVAALGSVAFAAFMIGEGNSLERLKKREISRSFARGFLGKPHTSAGSASKSNHRPATYSTIDYDITGSISKSGDGVTGQKIASDFANNESPPSADASKYNTYILRFVYKETALLQINHDLYVARRGTRLPKAGRVLSVERRGNQWRVVTTTQTFTRIKDDTP